MPPNFPPTAASSPTTENSAKRREPLWFRIGRAAGELLAPRLCTACDRPLLETRSRVELCSDCLRRLALDDALACRRCGDVLSTGSASGDDCAACRDDKSWRLDAVVRLGRYAGELRTAVLRAKRPGDAPLAAALAELLVERRGSELAALAANAIIPVPMYWTRRWLRGANAPETLTERLSARLRTPVASGWLVRSRPTEVLEPLSPTARREAVRRGFDVGRWRQWGRRWFGQTPPERVLLVDDVLTTGATANEAARTLKRAGVKYVACAVIARTEKRPG